MKYYLIHNIGHTQNANYNTPKQIEKVCEDPDVTLTFDGIYQNIWVHRHLLKRCANKPLLGVMWSFVGKDNNFDSPMPLELYCDWNQLMDLVLNYNCEFASHSWNHRNMQTLTDNEIKQELKSPIKCRLFFYPYGNVDERVAKLTRESGYEDAFSVVQGNNSEYQRNRSYLR